MASDGDVQTNSNQMYRWSGPGPTPYHASESPTAPVHEPEPVATNKSMAHDSTLAAYDSLSLAAYEMEQMHPGVFERNMMEQMHPGAFERDMIEQMYPGGFTTPNLEMAAKHPTAPDGVDVGPPRDQETAPVHTNQNPCTCPLGTVLNGVGTLAGGLAGTAAGGAVGGPIGVKVGSAIGAIGCEVAGELLHRVVNPTSNNAPAPDEQPEPKPEDNLMAMAYSSGWEPVPDWNDYSVTQDPSTYPTPMVNPLVITPVPDWLVYGGDVVTTYPTIPMVNPLATTPVPYGIGGSMW